MYPSTQNIFEHLLKYVYEFVQFVQEVSESNSISLSIVYALKIGAGLSQLSDWFVHKC